MNLIKLTIGREIARCVLFLTFFLFSSAAWASSWCTSVSYSAALTSGMNRNFGSSYNRGSQGQQCFASQTACESARQTASAGVTSTPCAQQGGTADSSAGFGNPGSSANPASPNAYRPNYRSFDTDDTDEPERPVVDATHIELEQPWGPPPTCVVKFPKMSDRYVSLLSRRKTVQNKIDAHSVRCSGVEAGSVVEAACTKEKKALQPEINAYLTNVQSLNETDRGTCESYLAQQGEEKADASAWTAGLGCAMDDVYGRAEALGDVGQAFVDELRRDVTALQQSTATAVSDPDAVGVVSLSENKLADWHRTLPLPAATDSGNQQFIVDVSAFRHSSDGSISFQVESAFRDSANRRSQEQTTIMVYDKTGHLVDGQYPATVRRCLRAAEKQTH